VVRVGSDIHLAVMRNGKPLAINARLAAQAGEKGRREGKTKAGRGDTGGGR